MKVRIKTASYHRNGVGGLGFHAILFDGSDRGEKYTNMIASLFDENGACAVYSVDELAKGNIAFAHGNSWRGDQFEAALRPALEEYQAKDGTNRIGPFALPDVPNEK